MPSWCCRPKYPDPPRSRRPETRPAAGTSSQPDPTQPVHSLAPRRCQESSQVRYGFSAYISPGTRLHLTTVGRPDLAKSGRYWPWGCCGGGRDGVPVRRCRQGYRCPWLNTILSAFRVSRNLRSARARASISAATTLQMITSPLLRACTRAVLPICRGPGMGDVAACRRAAAVDPRGLSARGSGEGRWHRERERDPADHQADDASVAADGVRLPLR